MEELEPWNMFTNDFETENDGNDCSNNGDEEPGENREGIAENEDENSNSDIQDDDTNFLVPEVTIGGDEIEEQSIIDDNDEPGEDDDAIFNFGLEPENSASDRPKRSKMSSKEIARNKKELESLINYDQAVVYICPACGSEFETQELWKRHMNGVHAYNTRHGLNFVQIDKLYHECMECFKRIAMHSMENLLKHKYTHLPYRCSKCKFCQRQYKYRQDLMVHLRTQHYEELIEAAKAAKEALDKQPDNNPISRGLAIREIKENAVDIFENTFGDNEPITVRNELMDQDDDNEFDGTAEHSRNSLLQPSFLEDALSRGSSHNSEPQSNGSGNGVVNEEQALYEKQIQYICPKCGQEYGTHNQWLQHIVGAHDYGSRRGLNFEEIHSNQARCLECEKVIPVNIIPNLQQHKFTHLPYKSWLRCKLCFHAFLNRPDILKHLANQHRLGMENNNAIRGGNDSHRGDIDDADDSQDIWDCDETLLTEDQRAPSKKKRNEERDVFDQHIEYLCPTCGSEFRVKKLWRKHIGNVHGLTSLEALYFKNVNEREVQCLECGKVITNAYGIQNAQQHYFTHMPFKSFIRCRLCAKSYTDRKGLVKHLRGKHFGRLKMPEAPSASPSVQKPSPHIHIAPKPQPPTSRPIQQMHSNQLLSRALQRPLRSADEPAPIKRPRQETYKEIVTRNNVVYEIQFLDEDDDQCDNEIGIVNAAEDDDDVLLVPEITAVNNGNRHSSFNGRERCADCGSIFSTLEALRAHIRKEHDFYERPRENNTHFGHSTPNTKDSYVEAADEQSNDDALLMPVSVENISDYKTSSKLTSAVSSADCHFTYLCPACGVEHYTQMDWRRHINGVHNFDKRHFLNFRQLGQDRFQCTICNDIVTKSKLKTLQDHKFRHLPYKSYLKCKHCGTLYNHKPNMFGHLQVRHNIYVSRTVGNDDLPGDDFGSPVVPVSLTQQAANTSRPLSGGNRSYGSSSSSMKASSSGSNSSSFAKPPGLKTVEDVITFHNAVDHATITYFCPSCNENFDSHVFWRKHIVEEHNLNSREGLNFRQIDEHHYLCLQCYKRVTVTHTKGAIGQLQSHKFRHLPYKSFKCLRCNGEFVRKQMFFKHLNRETNRCEAAIENVPNAQEQEPGSKQKASKPESKNGGENINAKNVQLDDTLDPYETQDDGTNSSLIMNQDAFVLVCPQCAAEFDSQRNWRDHINNEHDLGKRENLGFNTVTPMLHQCLECGEHVSGRKLRDLQIHRFKHMPYGPYIQCKFCKTGYSHIRNMQDHLRQKHPNVVQKHDEYAKMEEMRLYEECSLTDSLGGSSVVNEAELDDDDDDVQLVTGDINDEEQYLLG